MDSEDRISGLEASQDELYKQLAVAQREQWQGRVDDLELQAHLGAMEANDRVQPLLSELRSRWDEARSQLEDAASTAVAVTDTLRAGMELAIRDVRHALLESSKQLRS